MGIHWLSEGGRWCQSKIEVSETHTAIYEICDAV